MLYAYQVIRRLLLPFVLIAPAALAHPSWGIVVNRAGEVIYSDLVTVWKLDASGHARVVRPGEDGHHVHELAIDADDNVYGPEYDGTTTRIWKMTPSGRSSYINAPSIWRDSNGNTYSVEQNQQTRTTTRILKNGTELLAGGAFGHADGKGARARLGHIVAMTIGPDGALYVTDDPYVRRISLDGTVTTIASCDVRPAPNALNFGGIFGLAVAKNGDVYVADLRNRRVLLVHNRKVTTFATSTGPWLPTGVAVGPRGEVWVLEAQYPREATWLAPRVRKLTR